MLVARCVVGMFLAGLMTVGADAVSAQTYPTKPIRIVTLGIGGGADFHSRLIAPELISALGQPVVVDNRGASVIPLEIVSKAPPDGYTLLVTGGVLWVTALLQKTSFDPIRDFSPISLISKEVNVLVVNPSLPVKSVKELIALAKAKPGALNYASGPTGNPPHLAVELFKSLTGTNIVRIPYSGSGPALNGLMGGEAQFSMIGAAAVTPLVKSGRLRALAVTSAEPSAMFPELPTVAATVPGHELISVTVMVAPAKTPTAIVNLLSQTVARILTQANVREKLFNTAQEIVGSSPEQLAALMKTDMARIGKVIKDANIHAD